LRHFTEQANSSEACGDKMAGMGMLRKRLYVAKPSGIHRLIPAFKTISSF
jgi:hypothetical protein